MQSFAEALKAYTRDHPFDSGNGDSETVLDQLYQAYAESHEPDPPEISEGFKELEWSVSWNPCPWTITMPSLISAAASAPPTSGKPSMTACNTGRI